MGGEYGRNLQILAAGLAFSYRLTYYKLKQCMAEGQSALLSFSKYYISLEISTSIVLYLTSYCRYHETY